MRTTGCAALIGCAVIAGACSNGVPLGPTPTPSGDSSSAPSSSSAPAPPSASPPPAPTAPAPTTPAPTTPQPSAGGQSVAYTPDLQPVFDADCTPCHGGRSPAGRYSTATYAGIMAAVVRGSRSSPLVIVTAPGGPMYGFLTGDRNSKAALISQWVLNGAPQSR